MGGDGFFFCTQGGQGNISGDGFQLVQHVLGCSLNDAINRVAQQLGMDDSRSIAARAPRASPVIAQAVPEYSARNAAALERMLKACTPLHEEGEVARYLVARGLAEILDDMPVDLLEHSDLAHFTDGKLDGSYAAMIAVFRNASGDLVNLERKYVRDGAKADVPENRKLCSPCRPSRGAAVHLYEPTHCLALAEGIESALAVRLMSGWPTWACGSCGNMRTVDLPPWVREVAIWADHGVPGQMAAAALENRLHADGIAVTVHVPPRESMDPLDWFAERRT
jgi:putative DNA primase/helicase